MNGQFPATAEWRQCIKKADPSNLLGADWCGLVCFMSSGDSSCWRCMLGTRQDEEAYNTIVSI